MLEKKTSQVFSHRYEILQYLGEGGIGKVYRAQDRWMGKDVALKVLTTDVENPSLLDSFKREFLLLSQLKHPGVVEVLDFGYSEDAKKPGRLSPYFTMEFVEGKSLGEAFTNLLDPQQAPAEFEKLSHLIWQICDVLEFLHLRGMVHCDLKPDNLKVIDKVFRLKILDFGLAEKIGSKRGRETKGTLPYMAPEMFLEEPLDERTDLYSLGVILYELVTSKLPFPFDDPVRIVSAHLQQKPVPASELNQSLPPSLNRLIMKLLEKSPAHRPNNATGVKEMITAELRGNSQKTHKPDFSQEKTLLAQLYSGPLVGRGTELSQLEDDLKQALSSQGGCLFLSGEQGVGKTFLFKHLKIKCQLQGIIFADSNCLENQTLAYQPLIEILHKLKPYVENRCTGHILTNLREVFSWSGREPSTSPQDQTAFHQRITDLLVGISGFFPFVMVIENLQWTDFPTLQFLEYFQRQKDKGKIFLCCSLREEKLKQNTLPGSLINRCLKGKDVGYLKLSRFDLSPTKNLISSKFIKHRLPPMFFSYIHQRTSGNPFFIIEVLKYLLKKDIIFLRDSIWTTDTERLKESAVPDSIEAILLKNLERYDKKTLDFLNMLAVIGKKFTLRLTRGLNLFDEKTLWEILSFCTHDQLLIRKEESVRHKTYYEFANQSLQTLLYHKLDQVKRISWHKKVAELLEKISSKEEEESVFQIAHHYLQAERFDKAYKYALLSAEKIEQRFANDQVLRYLENAIKVASKLPDRQEAVKKQVAALMKRADFCRKVGELTRAERDYQAILKLTDSFSDLKISVKTYNDLAEIYRLKHDYKKGISCLKKAMKIHEKLDDPLEFAQTLSYMGLLYWIDSQYQNALDCFQKALQIDQRLGNKLYMASTLNNMGLVFWSQHQYLQALRYFTDSLSLYRDLDNEEWIARTLNNCGVTLFELGDYPRGVDHLLESLKLNEKIKNEKERTFNLENLSEAYRKIGEYSSSLEYGQRGLRLALEIDFKERVGRILRNLGVTHFELGEYQKAYGYFEKAREVAERIEDKELQVLVLIALCKFFAVLNNEKSSTQILEEAARITNTMGDEKSLISIHQIKGWLKKKEGEFEEALKLLDEAMALAKKLNVGEEIFSLNLDYAKFYLDRKDISKCKVFLNQARNSGLARYVLFQPAFYLISGRIEWTNGNLKLAQKDFETALRLAEKLNHPETLWRIHHHLGKLFLSTRDIERAYPELKNAGRVLKRLNENIEDKELKRNYLKDPKKKELLYDLKEVAKELIGETKLA